MKKITLYVGLNDKDSKVQEIDTLEASKIATKVITTYTDGGTIFNASGIYKHEDGTIVIENTLKIELIEPTEEAVNNIVNTLKVAFNQESIIKQSDIINSEFC